MIRPFNENDLHTLHRMICGTIDASYSGVYPPRAVGFFKEHHSEKKITERSSTGEILVLISERDGSILATGSLIDSEIVGVFVHPDHQRQGHGKAIMAELEKKARAKGLSEINLSVSLPSRMFYESLGYDVFDECDLDVGKGEYLRYWSGKKGLQPKKRIDRQRANMVTVESVKTASDASEIDELLWHILWRPIGLPRDIRSKFNIEGDKLELSAKQNRKIVGGLVAVWTSDNEIELRHLAVASDVQRKGIGRSLVTELCRIASVKKCYRIHTIARNTSAGFFRDVGFRAAPGRAPEHPIFLKHRITFELMEIIVEP